MTLKARKVIEAGRAAVEAPFRVKFVYDEDGSVETPHGTPLPGTREEYKGYEIMQLIDPADDPQTGKRRTVPYDEYRQFWGNPDRHVIVGCIVEKRCEACGHYEQAESLWNIDLMDDDADYLAVTMDHWYTPDEARALVGYLGETAKELLDQAKGA
jgi:hypothetical protein